MVLKMVRKYLFPLSRKGINKASVSIATNNKNQKVMGRFLIDLKSKCPYPSSFWFWEISDLFLSSRNTDFGLFYYLLKILFGLSFLLKTRDSWLIFYLSALLLSIYARINANTRDTIINPRPIKRGIPTFS